MASEQYPPAVRQQAPEEGSSATAAAVWHYANLVARRSRTLKSTASVLGICDPPHTVLPKDAGRVPLVGYSVVLKVRRSNCSAAPSQRVPMAAASWTPTATVCARLASRAWTCHWLRIGFWRRGRFWVVQGPLDWHRGRFWVQMPWTRHWLRIGFHDCGDPRLNLGALVTATHGAMKEPFRWDTKRIPSDRPTESPATEVTSRQAALEPSAEATGQLRTADLATGS